MNLVSKKFADLSNNQLYDLLQLRMEVFVLEQSCCYQDMDDKDRHPETLHLMAYGDSNDKDAKLEAYIRVLAPGVSYTDYASIGRVVTAKAARCKGLSKQLLLSGLSYCEQKWPGSAVKISAQAHLLEFYRQLGFFPIGEEYLEENIPHKAMIKDTAGPSSKA